jgi:hypothetical protein
MTLTCLIVCSAIALPFAAMAAMTDPQYCEALSAEYRRLNTQSTEANVADAMAQCKAGNTAAGIPVIEKAFKNGGASLPSRDGPMPKVTSP